jgi:hypothetical protein
MGRIAVGCTRVGGENSKIQNDLAPKDNENFVQN